MSRTTRYREAARVGLSDLDDALYASSHDPSWLVGFGLRVVGLAIGCAAADYLGLRHVLEAAFRRWLS